ncbi:MAG: HD domain-containing protein [Helicobacteraceae bacterium]|nr:HD domain-containing protein [Helicobacteraceae bacterium]
MVQRESLSANELLETIFSYVTKLSSMKEHEKMLLVLADMGRVLSNAERCSVWLLSEDKERIWTKVAHGIEALEIQSDLGIVGDAIKKDQKLIIDDVYKDARFNSDIDKQTGYKTKSMMVVPIYDEENEVMGAFQVVNSRSSDEIFETRDMERLLLASSYASEILIASKLTKEIEDTQKEVVFTMGAIGESRSKETGNHVKRVAQYSKILALGFGLPEEEAELLKNASPMHDIGKVAIPDAILNKPGRFNNEERTIMDTHAELGYKMIKNSNRPLLQAASIVAYQHHEKWDGSGYPQGLKEEEIHIYGRITALADVYDALGSDRVYKKAWDDEKIYSLLQEERGRHFDPQLIDIFFENLEAILAVREKLKDEFENE